MNTKELISALETLQERHGTKRVMLKISDTTNNSINVLAGVVYYDEDKNLVIIEKGPA